MLLKRRATYTTRCLICIRKQPVRCLLNHYKKCHSKEKIVKQLVKNSVRRLMPKILKKRKQRRNKTIRVKKGNTGSRQMKTVYLNGDIQILCGKNDIVISDGKNTFDLELTFNNNAWEWKEVEKTDAKNCLIHSYSSSASSEESDKSFKVIKKKVKRKRVLLKRLGYYCINITKLKNSKLLDDKSGEFHNPPPSDNSDLKIVTSDTESCSDTGTPVDTKLFCSSCGSGYNTEIELTQHMQIHETFCSLCKTTFVNEFIFREHMRTHLFKVCHVCNAEFVSNEALQTHFEEHVKDRILDGVLDMEQEYKCFNLNFCGSDYNTSINNILYFLHDGYSYCHCNENWHDVRCTFHNNLHY